MSYKNPEDLAAYNARNRDRRRGWERAYYALNRERLRAYQNAWHAERVITHPEEMRAQHKRYNDKRKAYTAAYAKAHAEERKAWMRAYSVTNRIRTGGETIWLKQLPPEAAELFRTLKEARRVIRGEAP